MSDLSKHFTPINIQAWKQKVQAELAGLDYNQTLVWNAENNINVKPIYSKESIDYREIKPLNKPQNDWKIIGDFSTNKTLDYSYLYGLKVTKEQINDLNKLPEHLDLFIDNFKELPSYNFDGIPNLKYLDFDSYGILAKTGNWHQNSEKKANELTQNLLNNNSLEKAIAIDVALYQNAGATHTQQLALALLHANEYLTQFGDSSAQKMYFKVAVGSNYFFEIAKLKALRWLWQTLLDEYNIDSPIFIYAESSQRNKSLLDIHNNLIRTTLEASAAVLGGADAVYISPFNALKNSTNFSEELASKQQLLLKKECFYDEFNDPIAGSYYVEKITEELANNALEQFKNLETQGGFLRNLFNHSIQKMIKTSATKEQELFNTGKIKLIGVNKFRNENEKIDSITIEKNEQKVLFPTIIAKRLAESIEQSL